MKSSAWYHNVWRKKLEELPYRGDTGKAWAEMNKILDEHMPAVQVVSGGGKAVKPFASKIISLLGIILPVAAMLCTITYFAVKHQYAKPINKKQPVAVAKSTVDVNANTPMLADSNGALISRQSDNSLKQISPVNYQSGADSSNSHAKNSTRYPIAQSLFIAPPLTSSKLISKALSDSAKKILLKRHLNAWWPQWLYQ